MRQESILVPQESILVAQESILVAEESILVESILIDFSLFFQCFRAAGTRRHTPAQPPAHAGTIRHNPAQILAQNPAQRAGPPGEDSGALFST